MPTTVAVSAKKTTAPVRRVASAKKDVPATSAKKSVTATPVKVTQKSDQVKVEVTPVETISESPVSTQKQRKQRPRVRPFAEVYSAIHEDINQAYKCLQAATRALKSLESAHNREVHNTRSRTNTQRTPTIVFDQVLVDYFLNRLEPSDLNVTRKDGDKDVTVDLSSLNTDTRVHRTDVTQLYNKTFMKHDMRDSSDRRYILYQNDPELVTLLTQGEIKPELQEEVQQILDGTYKLTIFNIQRFTSQHLGKVDLGKRENTAETTISA